MFIIHTKTPNEESLRRIRLLWRLLQPLQLRVQLSVQVPLHTITCLARLLMPLFLVDIAVLVGLLVMISLVLYWNGAIPTIAALPVFAPVWMAPPADSTQVRSAIIVRWVAVISTAMPRCPALITRNLYSARSSKRTILRVTGRQSASLISRFRNGKIRLKSSLCSYALSS